MKIRSVADDIIEILEKTGGLTAEEISNLINVDVEVVEEIMRIFEEKKLVVIDYGIKKNKHSLFNKISIEDELSEIKKVVRNENNWSIDEPIRIREIS